MTLRNLVRSLAASLLLLHVSAFALGPVTNYQGLWWNAAEPGGDQLRASGDHIFATWYTYDTSGHAWWLSTLATETSDSTFEGPIYVNSGPPFNNYIGMGVPNAIGNGTLTFTDANNGSFDYTVKPMMSRTTQTKAITRFDLGTGPQPTCNYSDTTPDFEAASNYQDLWWVPNGAESGWELTLHTRATASLRPGTRTTSLVTPVVAIGAGHATRDDQRLCRIDLPELGAALRCLRRHESVGESGPHCNALLCQWQ